MNLTQLARFEQTESARASADLAEASPQLALVRFFRRHEAVLADAIEASPTKPACRAGCAYCCNYKVEASALELLAIGEFVASRFGPERIRGITERAERNVREAAGLSYGEQRASNQPCPLLIDGQCSVYEVRPSMCRNFLVADVRGCIESFEHPDRQGVPDACIDTLFEAGNGTTNGFKRAVRDAGLDPRVYDLDSGLLDAMRGPEPGGASVAGGPSLRTAKVVGEREPSGVRHRG